MNVCVIGTGYVGLVTGACFAEFGVSVICTDTDAAKIEALQRGRIPIYEPGLETLVARNVEQGRLSFTTDTADALRSSLVLFIAVQTPTLAGGGTDLSSIEAVAREIGRALNGYKLVVTKSTVPVGTTQRVKQWIREEQSAAGRDETFAVASNPEFLREGAAIGDFMRPDRVVIGAEDDASRAILRDLYRPLFLNETPFLMTNVATSELIKYAANAFLATKISFINEFANLCEAVGADVQALARGIGLDGRIGKKFLHAGPGFGGSCLPKDTRAATHFARAVGESLEIVEASVRVNDRQRARMIEKVERAVGGSLAGKTIGLLGISFKPETDDVREAPSLDIARGLAARGAAVRAFDPVAMRAAEPQLPDVTLCKDAYHACEGADAAVIVTEWNQFRMLDLARVRRALREPVMVDLRNVYEPEALRKAGFEYTSVGR